MATFRSPDGKGAAAVMANSNPRAQEVDVGGLPPNTRVQMLVWNRQGKATLSSQFVTTDLNGVARLTVPPHGVAALTTRMDPPAP